jgi:hypothetical protein
MSVVLASFITSRSRSYSARADSPVETVLGHRKGGRVGTFPLGLGVLGLQALDLGTELEVAAAEPVEEA